ncbi:MAG: UDP-N-acetylmuramoyl-L-alanine--D-glutamate ligase [Desulfobacteraceae bacterium]|nr:UDP-N-acetylmuramoyl-L-alanine--D-glutamate ligase [Desulfobacteraceae bacterium]
MSATAAKRVLVVGLGISGRAVCALLRSRGADVFATDMRTVEAFGEALEPLRKSGCILRLGEHRSEDFLGSGLIIVSPGVPLDIEPLKEARDKGIEILGEFEWSWRQVSVPVIGVTGTNGKTTTTGLIGEMLKEAGKKPFVGGNIGTPLSRWLLSKTGEDILVLEVSSYQLDTATRFCPEVGVLLNVTEDHLDRYEDFEAYADSKLSIFRRQNAAHFAIINGDDPICRAGLREIPSRVLLFSSVDADAHACVRGDSIRIAIPGRPPFGLSLEKTRLKGAHNRENIMAAALAASVMGAGPAAIQAAVDRFEGYAHRVEWVRNWKGIDFYDDSKGTNVGAVVKALEGFDRPVHLLLGGRDKLGSYDPLVEPLKRKGKGVYAFGEAGPRICEQLGQRFPARLFPDLPSAFNEAVGQASPGDVVLLSPACSSFDQYESYGQRGDHFKRLAAELD